MTKIQSLARASALAFWLAGMVVGIPATAQVTYFDHPPSQEELRRALGLDDAPVAAGSPVRVRGIGAGNLDGATGRAPSAPGLAPGSSGANVSSAKAALNIQFDLGSSRITSASVPYLESIVELMRKDVQTRFQVQGHTDARGERKANILLSWERALAVYRIMVERYGIDPDRLQPVGKGASEPLADREPLDGTNRRVQFGILLG